MKTSFLSLFLCLFAAAAEAQNARPSPPQPPPQSIPGAPAAPVESAPEEPPVVEDFLNPGRYQLITTQVTVAGRERSIVLRLDTATGKVWVLESTPDAVPGKSFLRFMEVQDNLPRPRPGFPGGGIPGGVGIETAPAQPPPPPPVRRPDPNR